MNSFEMIIRKAFPGSESINNSFRI